MRKTFLSLLVIFAVQAYGQNKKTGPKKTIITAVGQWSAELLERKDNFRFYVTNAKDTLTAKTIEKKNGAPSGVKITPVTCSGSRLHSIVWTEKKTIGDAKSKLENVAETHIEIWDAASKTKVYENVQTVNNITEIVWLDPNKTASKTVEKVQRGGSECFVSAQGDIILKTNHRNRNSSTTPRRKSSSPKNKNRASFPVVALEFRMEECDQF